MGNYRQTVLQAFGPVADVLESLQHDAALLDTQRTALDTALAALDLTQQSYQAGQANLLQLLEAQRYADTAHLFIVMGGAIAPAAELTHSTRSSVAAAFASVCGCRLLDSCQPRC